MGGPERQLYRYVPREEAGMSSKLIYRDVAVGAEADAEITATEYSSMGDPAKAASGVSTPPLAVLELNGWGLDGARKIYDKQPMAFVSTELSGLDRAFKIPPTIRVDFDNNYTTLGLTVRFARAANEWCSTVTVTWYRDGEQLAQETFYPDRPEYYCEHTVEAYDRVDIALEETAMPYQRARVEQIQFGSVREFTAGELGSVTIQQEVDPISATVSANYLDWELRSTDDTEYIFQLKQPVEVCHNDELLGVFYVDSIPERTDAGIYSVECQDAVGALDSYDWPGKMYTEDTAFAAIIGDIVDGAFDVDIDEALTAKTLRGLIPEGTRREALQQAAFAAGAVVDTSRTHKIRFFAPSYTDPTVIPKRDVVTGGSVKQSAIVTSVVVTYHTYTQGAGSSGDDVVTVGGVKYVHTTGTVTVNNPNVTASDKQNVKTVTDATLVNSSNANEVAQRVYDYWMRRKTVSTKIVLDDERMMDYVTVPTPWEQDMTGSIISAKITLSNLTAADIEVLV